MKRPGIIFIFLSIYIILAFGWWTFAHIRSSRMLYEQQKENLELLCYKATIECNGAVEQHMVFDTTTLKAFFEPNFPDLELIFTGEDPGIDEYMIRPKESSYDRLDSKFRRKLMMYTLEGVVMVCLLFWGITWVYRSLLSRLQLNKMQNNFLLSITHELKTPLASVKLYLETLQKRQLSKEQSDTIVGNSINDVNRLRDLVDNILMAAQLDSKKFELHKFETNVSETIETAIEKFVLPRNMRSRVKTAIQPDIFLNTDKMALEIIVINLLSNAEKYSSPDSLIEVTLKDTGSAIQLTLADQGIGIADEDKKNLFNKFFRTGDEQTRKTKGTGLGLFIVKNLLNLMHGEIEVKNNKPKGTIFGITLRK